MTDRWLRSKGGYIFDRRYFLGCLGLLCLIMGVAFLSTTGYGRHYYMTCPSDTRDPCVNPFIEGERCTANDALLCSIPTLQPGETWGEPPPWLVANAYLLNFLAIIGAFAANHFHHNRRFGLWRKLWSNL